MEARMGGRQEVKLTPSWQQRGLSRRLQRVLYLWGFVPQGGSAISTKRPRGQPTRNVPTTIIKMSRTQTTFQCIWFGCVASVNVTADMVQVEAGIPADNCSLPLSSSSPEVFVAFPETAGFDNGLMQSCSWFLARGREETSSHLKCGP